MLRIYSPIESNYFVPAFRKFLQGKVSIFRKNNLKIKFGLKNKFLTFCLPKK